MLPSGSSVSFIIGSVHEKRRCHREQPPTTTFIKLIVIIVICTGGCRASICRFVAACDSAMAGAATELEFLQSQPSSPFTPKDNRRLGFVTQSMVREHLSRCKRHSGSCVLCRWGRSGAKWQRKCLLPETGPAAANDNDDPQTWLRMGFVISYNIKDTQPSFRFGMGCQVCWWHWVSTGTVQASGGELTYGEFKLQDFKFTNAQRHLGTSVHLEAVDAYVRFGSPSNLLIHPPLRGRRRQGQDGVPEGFLTVLRSYRSGQSMRSIAKTQGHRHSCKVRGMCALTAEIIRMQDRQFLSQAVCICLIRDERKGKLLIRFRACKANLETRSGVLGFATIPDAGFAEVLLDTTKQILKDFCPMPQFQTWWVGKDYRPFKAADFVQEHIQKHAQIIVTDTAANELLATQLGRGERERADIGCREDFFCRSQVIGRDRAHACPRLLKDSWARLDTIDELVKCTITGKTSVAQKIFRSEAHEQWFRTAVQSSSDEDKQWGQTLCAAKHRFCSFATPLRRIVIHIKAIISTVQRVAALRDESGQWARQWLENLTSARILLLGLLADAAAEVYELNLFFDSEDVDSALIVERVEQFLDRLQVLFIDGEVRSLPHTYTSHVIKKFPFFVPNKHGFTQLDFSETDYQAASRHLKLWCKLAWHACETEFPQCCVFRAMHLFDLSVRSKESSPSTNSEASFARLAACFGVDAKQLKKEYTHIYPLAAAKFKGSGLDNRSCWQAVCSAKVRTSRQTLKSLLPVVYGYLAWTTSSSSVEQLFSRVQRSGLDMVRGPKAHRALQRAVRIIGAEWSEDRETEVARLGSTIYDLTRKEPWKCNLKRKRRVDCGVRKDRLKRRKASEGAWMDLRSKEIALKSQTVTDHEAMKQAGGEAVPDKVVQEISRQQARLRKRELESAAEGMTRSEEAVLRLQAQYKKNDKTRRTKFLNAQVKLAERLGRMSDPLSLPCPKAARLRQGRKDQVAWRVHWRSGPDTSQAQAKAILDSAVQKLQDRSAEGVVVGAAKDPVVLMLFS